LFIIKTLADHPHKKEKLADSSSKTLDVFMLQNPNRRQLLPLLLPFIINYSYLLTNQMVLPVTSIASANFCCCRYILASIILMWFYSLLLLMSLSTANIYYCSFAEP